MKKLYSYILLMACAILFAGCQKELNGVLTANLENYQGDNGKVYIDNNFACWHNGDELWVNNDSCHIEIAGDVATIKGVNTASTFNAIYPIWNSNDGNQVYFGDELEYYTALTPNGDKVQYVDAPMVAKTTTNHPDQLSFYNLGSLLKVTLKNEVPNNPDIVLLAVLITATTDGATLWGKANYEFDGNSAPTNITLTNSDPSKNQIGMMCEEFLPSGNSATMYIPIPPITSSFKVEAAYFDVNNEDSLYMFSTEPSQENTIGRNTIVNMGTISINGGEIMDGPGGGDGPSIDEGSPTAPPALVPLDTVYINNYQALVNAMGTTGGMQKHYIQTDDITLPAGFAGFGTTNNPFLGYYDGQGHTITYAGEGTSGLFNVVGNSDKSGNFAFMNINVVANINASGDKVGGIINDAHCKNIRIKNCKVSGTITSSNANAKIGGLVGQLGHTCSVPPNSHPDYNAFNIDSCINTATLGSSTHTGYVGGICGAVGHCNLYNTENAVIFKNCVNKGTLQIGRNGTAAGIVALLDDYAYITVQNSYSHIGTLHANMAGIVGKYLSSAMSFDYRLKLENIYVRGNIGLEVDNINPPANKPKWIALCDAATATNIYRPKIEKDNIYDGIGINAIKYDSTSTTKNIIYASGNETTTTLLGALKIHQGTHAPWIDINGWPGFNFENQTTTTPIPIPVSPKYGNKYDRYKSMLPHRRR